MATSGLRSHSSPVLRHSPYPSGQDSVVFTSDSCHLMVTCQGTGKPWLVLVNQPFSGVHTHGAPVI